MTEIAEALGAMAEHVPGFLHHRANDESIVVGPDGEYRPEVEPEDWYFSRLLNELGLKVGCTRKVRLTHRGPFAFPNVTSLMP